MFPDLRPFQLVGTIDSPYSAKHYISTSPGWGYTIGLVVGPYTDCDGKVHEAAFGIDGGEGMQWGGMTLEMAERWLKHYGVK